MIALEPYVPITVLCILAAALAVLGAVRLWRNGGGAWSAAFSVSAGVAAGAFWTLVFYPALMSPDSIDYWREALAGRYTDWQPPFMAFLMRVVILSCGPKVAVYTFLQAAAFYVAVFFLITALTRGQPAPIRGRVRVLSALLFLIYPVGWVYSVTAWKDVLFTLVVCVLSACLARFLDTGRRADVVLALTFLGLALATRHNAIVLVPAAAILLHAAPKRALGSGLRGWIAAGLLCVAMAFPSALAQALAVRHSDRSIVPVSLLLGYARTLERTAGRTHAPSEAFWNEALGEGGYRRLMDKDWACGDEWTLVFDREVDKKRIQNAVGRNPLGVLRILGDFVVHEPQASLGHHVCVLAKLIGFRPATRRPHWRGRMEDHLWYQAGLADNELGLVSASRLPTVQAVAFRSVGAAFHAGLCSHWISLALLASLLVWAFSPHGRQPEAAAIDLGVARSGSIVVPTIGLTYFASFCLIPIAYDWRYLLLPTVLAVVVLCVLVSHAVVRLAARHGDGPPP